VARRRRLIQPTLWPILPDGRRIRRRARTLARGRAGQDAHARGRGATDPMVHGPVCDLGKHVDTKGRRGGRARHGLGIVVAGCIVETARDGRRVDAARHDAEKIQEELAVQETGKSERRVSILFFLLCFRDLIGVVLEMKRGADESFDCWGPILRSNVQGGLTYLRRH
jgi:hypothetical protein